MRKKILIVISILILLFILIFILQHNNYIQFNKNSGLSSKPIYHTSKTNEMGWQEPCKNRAAKKHINKDKMWEEAVKCHVIEYSLDNEKIYLISIDYGFTGGSETLLLYSNGAKVTGYNNFMLETKSIFDFTKYGLACNNWGKAWDMAFWDKHNDNYEHFLIKEGNTYKWKYILNNFKKAVPDSYGAPDFSCDRSGIITIDISGDNIKKEDLKVTGFSQTNDCSKYIEDSWELNRCCYQFRRTKNSLPQYSNIKSQYCFDTDLEQCLNSKTKTSCLMDLARLNKNPSVCEKIDPIAHPDVIQRCFEGAK